MKTIQQIEAALAQQAERETALIELAIDMGYAWRRGLIDKPTPDDVQKRFVEVKGGDAL